MNPLTGRKAGTVDLREAKATSKLLHALAGDTALDPVTAAAVIETLSFNAGTALQVSAVLTPAAVQNAVATSTRPYLELTRDHWRAPVSEQTTTRPGPVPA